MTADSEIISRLRALEERVPPPIPVVDPTANVLDLVAAGTKRQDDLRELSEKYQDKLREQAERFQHQLADERKKADAEAKIAEASRIDALLLANKNDVALALSKQQAQAEAQDKRIAIVEQNQYQGVGAKGQSVENRQQSQWVIGLVIGLVVTLVSIVLHFWK